MPGLGGRGLWLGLAVAAAAAAMAARLMGWWSPRADFRLFIPEELARYRGRPGDPGLYLALLGRVYDVSSGRRHYEPGAHYSGFAGRDASRAFVTGDYSEAGLVDDVSDLSFSEMLTLQNWLSFYEKNYKFMGRVIGRFYGEDGLPTPELTHAEVMMTKGLEANRQELIEKQRFPPCNAEWSFIRGSRFWCSQQSCRLVRAAFLIISAGTADSTVLASNLHLLPRDSSGFPGWFHHRHLKAAPSHQGLHPTSFQVLAIPPPYLLPAFLWLRPSFLTCSNCTPSSCNPTAPCQVISSDQGIILQLNLFHGSQICRD
nr:neuferricin isoform X1 [Odocoileus virginianus texanus]